jgi:hypothetical protein
MQRKFSYAKYWYWRLRRMARDYTEPRGLFLLALALSVATLILYLS